MIIATKNQQVRLTTATSPSPTKPSSPGGGRGMNKTLRTTAETIATGTNNR